MATTNFFRQVARLNITGSLLLNIAKGEDDKLIVSVLLQNQGCGDKAKSLIPPLTFTEIPQKIDEAFFQDIKSPMELTSAVMVDMENYLKQVEAAKSQSALEKSKASKPVTAPKTETKQDKYNAAMQKVDELEKKGEFKEAWMKVPMAEEYPEHAEEIQNRRTSLSAKFAPDLFNAPATPKPLEEPKKENDPLYPAYATGEIEQEWEEEDQDQNN
ncbi:MAG: prtrc system protein e [Flavobacterium sp.]|nr:prtrc system protein e [Flavobacterium sp.]